MASSFFFYDLETSGFNPRAARVMQFAGQRTGMDLQPVGEPVNVLIKLTPDVLPDPDAILVTGITPQQTIADGVTEAEFLKNFQKEVATPGTIFVGYNSVRFDDEFMRYLQYRNFYDAYEWQWKDNRSRWDLLDVVRMTRALRPEGIEWPFAPDGRPSNRLELLTSVNKIDHVGAHDALVDVRATIALAKLIQTRQPKLFGFLLDMRDKKKVAALVGARQPFVYTSGKYPSEFEKTTVAVMLADHPKKQGVLVYDLRHDPSEFAKMSAQGLVEAWRWKKDRAENGPQLPVKTLQFNRCPAVAPPSVLDEASQKRLQIDLKTIEANSKKLTESADFVPKLLEALDLLDREQKQAQLVGDEQAVDAQLYDGFFSDADCAGMQTVHSADPDELDSLAPSFRDNRLKALLSLYKARNFPEALTPGERGDWEKFCQQRLAGGAQQSRLAKYFERLQTLAAAPGVTKNQQYLLEELKLYGESIMPTNEET
ncbi:MAG TPA: exodeoxyribonuclease I [Candidatus Saccharimonadales bacterium]|jgi:exodeoxyribonuclease-1